MRSPSHSTPMAGPLTGAAPWGALLGAVLGALVVTGGCVSLPQAVGPTPLYDLDTVWFNDGIGGVAPWRSPGRLANVAAVQQIRKREASKARRAARSGAKEARRARPSAKKRPKRTTKRAPPKAKRSNKRTTKKATKRPTKRPSRAKKSQRAPMLTSIQAGSRDRDARSEAAKSGRPLLGDGSRRGEVLAGAQRTVGLEDGFDARGWMSHILTVAAIDLDLKAPRARFAATLLRALEAQGATFDDRPEAGDLAFLKGVDDLDGDGRVDRGVTTVAVVERVEPSGVIVCIAELHGQVRRFRMDPERPRVRRDESDGVIINDAIRRRSRGDDPDARTLAGDLWVTWARL